MPRKPTRKQKKVVKILAENDGISLRGAILQAGYSEEMANNPSKVVEAKGFLDYLEEYLPDEKLAAVHSEGLNAVKTTRDKFGDRYEDPDYWTRHAYLETAYKIKGRLNPPNNDTGGNITVQLVVYGKQDNTNPVSVSAKRIPNAIAGSDGRRIQASSDSVAPQEREG